MVVSHDLLFVDGLTVNLPPGIDNIGQNKRYEQRYPEHGVEREVTAARVFDGQ